MHKSFTYLSNEISFNSSVEDLLDDNNNQLGPNWKCPAKETKSSRQRREMNAGKGVNRPYFLLNLLSCF